MQPRWRKAGLGRESVKVHGAGLEARQHLFDRALQVVKLDGSACVQSALFRETAYGAKGDGRLFIHLLRGTTKDGSQFEETHVADVAVQVSGNHGQHSRDD